MYFYFFATQFFFGQLSCVWQWAKCLPASRRQILPRLVPTPGFLALQPVASQVTASDTHCAFSTRLIDRYNDDVLYFRQTVPWYDGIGSYLLFQINDSHGSLQIRETPDKK